MPRSSALSLKQPLRLTDALASPDEGVRFGGPTALAAETRPRPLVHVSPFASMLAAAAERARVYVACLRNFEATANEIALQHRRVVLIGAGEDGEVCAADQMATAWLALRMQGRDFDLEGRHTVDEVKRWGPSDVSLIGLSRSAERLRALGREADVAFVLAPRQRPERRGRLRGRRDLRPGRPAQAAREETPTPAWGTPRAVGRCRCRTLSA